MAMERAADRKVQEGFRTVIVLSPFLMCVKAYLVGCESIISGLQEAVAVNSSIAAADLGTHLKIITVALFWATAITIAAIMLH